eukprot:8031930-Karenia_brevis.AAC.1
MANLSTAWQTIPDNRRRDCKGWQPVAERDRSVFADLVMDNLQITDFGCGSGGLDIFQQTVRDAGESVNFTTAAGRK